MHGKMKNRDHFKDLTRTDQSLVKTLALLASRDYQNYHGDTRENRNSRQLLFYERLIQTILDDGGAAAARQNPPPVTNRAYLFSAESHSLTPIT